MSSPKMPLLGVHVLLIDDDDHTRELFRLALEDAGAEERSECDAKGGMRTALQWQPDVIVSDLSMPEMDGFTLLREMRSVQQLRKVPAIAVSGLSRDKDRAAARAAGFQELRAKPFEPYHLIALVDGWARSSRGASSKSVQPA